MPIVGSLAECRPNQLLRMLALGRKTGWLTIQGPNRSVEAYFRDGRLDLLRAPEVRPLLDALAAAGVLSAEQLANLPHADGGERKLATLLDDFGYVEPSRMLAALRAQAAEVVRTILRWDRGSFRFDERADPPADYVALGFDVLSLVAGPPSPVAADAAGRFAAPPSPVAVSELPEAPAPKRRSWWNRLRGGRDDRRQ